MGLMKTSTLREEIPQVRLHPNAKLAPTQRLLPIRRIRQDGWSVTDARGREVHYVGALDYLSDNQRKEMMRRPDMILQLCHHLGRVFARRAPGEGDSRPP